MVKRERLLSFEEITFLVKVMAGMGVRRVRLTGGEPTLRKGLVELVAAIRAIEGIEEIAMTSNAHLLPTMAGALADAGLNSVNVSLDTLEAGPFAQLTRRGDVARVIRGIDAALASGLRVSTNAVALMGVNDKEVVQLCEFAWDRGILPRFIEHMPMSGGDTYDANSQLSAAQIRDSIRAHYDQELVAVGGDKGRGPARYWTVGETAREGGVGERRFGIISAMSEHFCSTCNRLRLSAIGQLHTCLAHDDALDLKSILRAGSTGQLVTKEVVQEAIRGALSLKKEGHEFDTSGTGGPSKHMISIGG